MAVVRCLPQCGPLAQLAEQQTLNLRVEGSIPSRLTTFSEHFFHFCEGRGVVQWLRMRLGCGWLRRRIIKPIDSGPIRAGDQMSVRVDGDLDRRVSELLL